MFTPKDIWWTKCQIFLLLLLVTSTELCIKYCWCWFQMSLIVRSKDNDKSRQHAPSWHKPWGLGKHMLECLWSTWQSICEQGCHWEWWKVIGEVVKPLVRQITTYFGSHLGIVGVEVYMQCGVVWYGTWWGKKYPFMVQTTLFTNWFAHMCCYPFFLSWTHFGPNYFIKHFSGSWHNKTSRDDHSDWDPVPHCLTYFLFVSLNRLSPGRDLGSWDLSSPRIYDQ